MSGRARESDSELTIESAGTARCVRNDTPARHRTPRDTARRHLCDRAENTCLVDTTSAYTADFYDARLTDGDRNRAACRTAEDSRAGQTRPRPNPRSPAASPCILPCTRAGSTGGCRHVGRSYKAVAVRFETAKRTVQRRNSLPHDLADAVAQHLPIGLLALVALHRDLGLAASAWNNDIDLAWRAVALMTDQSTRVLAVR